MQKLLTELFLSHLKAPAAGRVEITDIKEPGLTFRLSASGARAWSFRFRDPTSGRVSRQTFAGELTLKEARAMAFDARRQVSKGHNPVEVKRRERQHAETRTFDALAARYMKEHALRFKRTAAADERMLRLHVLPNWGKRRYDAIGRADVVELCESIVTAGKPTQANRVQALISKIFAFALDADVVASNPCARLKKRTKEVIRTRVLSDDELRLFWRRIGQSPNSDRIGKALRLVLLTGARVNEVAGAKAKEFDRLDEQYAATWTIPAGRSKNGKVHVIPLSDLARKVAQELIQMAQRRGGNASNEFLLPSPTGRGEPIAGHALSVAMLRFGEVMALRVEGSEIAGAKSWATERPSAHDLRRTMATRMSASGIPAEDISACLNHSAKGVTALHYNHYARDREKRHAFAVWAQQLEAITDGRIASNVVPIRETG